jgi:hypothetical protein
VARRGAAVHARNDDEARVADLVSLDAVRELGYDVQPAGAFPGWLG